MLWVMQVVTTPVVGVRRASGWWYPGRQCIAAGWGRRRGLEHTNFESLQKGPVRTARPLSACSKPATGPVRSSCADGSVNKPIPPARSKTTGFSLKPPQRAAPKFTQGLILGTMSGRAPIYRSHVELIEPPIWPQYPHARTDAGPATDYTHPTVRGQVEISTGTPGAAIWRGVRAESG